MDDLKPRVEFLEQWRVKVDIAMAREDENRKHMDKRFDAIESDIKEMSGWVKKAIGVVAVLVLTAMVRWIMNGGLGGV